MMENEELSDFEEWRQEFEAIKEPDGSIDLSKHHDFIRLSLGLPRKNIDWKNLPDCYGDTVSYELPKLVE